MSYNLLGLLCFNMSYAASYITSNASQDSSTGLIKIIVSDLKIFGAKNRTEMTYSMYWPSWLHQGQKDFDNFWCRKSHKKDDFRDRIYDHKLTVFDVFWI